jgi:hypothetical protein
MREKGDEWERVGAWCERKKVLAKALSRTSPRHLASFEGRFASMDNSNFKSHMDNSRFTSQ